MSETRPLAAAGAILVAMLVIGFIDNFVVSPLGTYLTAKNQHGVGMGAIRE